MQQHARDVIPEGTLSPEPCVESEREVHCWTCHVVHQERTIVRGVLERRVLDDQTKIVVDVRIV